MCLMTTDSKNCDDQHGLCEKMGSIFQDHWCTSKIESVILGQRNPRHGGLWLCIELLGVYLERL